jgi:hypothetical protein
VGNRAEHDRFVVRAYEYAISEWPYRTPQEIEDTLTNGQFEVLMTALLARKQTEADHLTVAIANGYAISMSAEAAAKWRADHALDYSAPAAVQRQSASMARLAGLFPGAVKAKVN